MQERAFKSLQKNEVKNSFAILFFPLPPSISLGVGSEREEEREEKTGGLTERNGEEDLMPLTDSPIFSKYIFFFFFFPHPLKKSLKKHDNEEGGIWEKSQPPTLRKSTHKLVRNPKNRKSSNFLVIPIPLPPPSFPTHWGPP